MRWLPRTSLSMNVRRKADGTYVVRVTRRVTSSTKLFISDPGTSSEGETKTYTSASRPRSAEAAWREARRQEQGAAGEAAPAPKPAPKRAPVTAQRSAAIDAAVQAHMAALDKIASEAGAEIMMAIGRHDGTLPAGADDRHSLAEDVRFTAGHWIGMMDCEDPADLIKRITEAGNPTARNWHPDGPGDVPAAARAAAADVMESIGRRGGTLPAGAPRDALEDEIHEAAARWFTIAADAERAWAASIAIL